MLSLLAVARAQTVPALVNYQGRLANPDGSPLPTADYTLTFNLFDATTNGARVWGPQMFDAAVAQGHGARVPVVQGWFNVMLGPVDTNGVSLADAFNGTSRYVEVTVSNRPPHRPAPADSHHALRLPGRELGEARGLRLERGVRDQQPGGRDDSVQQTGAAGGGDECGGWRNWCNATSNRQQSADWVSRFQRYPCGNRQTCIFGINSRSARPEFRNLR